jgi:hypothetical protein
MPVTSRFYGFPTAPVLLLGLALFGCGSKGAVSLSARVENATLSVQPLALGTQLTGEFDLVLELGSAAPEATTVTLGSFSLKNAETTLVEALNASASESFPLALGAGKSLSVHFFLDQTKLIDADLGAALCAGEVWYAGTVTDTLSDGKPTVASSNRLVPSCE